MVSPDNNATNGYFKKILASFLLGVVVTVVGLIVAATFIFDSSRPSCGKCTDAQYDISSLSAVLAIYGLDHGDYPLDSSNFSNLLTADLLGSFSRDPWGNMYQYARYQTRNHNCFLIWSFGSDGVPGGKNEHERDVYYYPTPGNCVKK